MIIDAFGSKVYCYIKHVMHKGNFMKFENIENTDIMLRGKYVILTTDYKKAILLEYFVMRQENDNDWVSASFPTISKESLLNLSIPALKNYIDDLIKNKWISYRTDPKATFGSSYQYKVNFDQINQDLEKLQKQAINNLSPQAAKDS